MGEDMEDKQVVEVNEEVVEKEVLEKNQKGKLQLTALKVLSVILYCLVAVILSILFISTIKEGNGLSYAVFLIVLVSYGGVALAICLIVALVGMLIAIAKRKVYEVKGTVKFFIVFIILPLITFLVMFLTTVIMANS